MRVHYEPAYSDMIIVFDLSIPGIIQRGRTDAYGETSWMEERESEGLYAPSRKQGTINS